MNSICVSCIYRGTHFCKECHTGGTEMADPSMFDDGSYDQVNHPDDYAEKILSLDAEREENDHEYY